MKFLYVKQRKNEAGRTALMLYIAMRCYSVPHPQFGVDPH